MTTVGIDDGVNKKAVPQLWGGTGQSDLSSHLFQRPLLRTPAAARRRKADMQLGWNGFAVMCAPFQ
jgi:hypothetical protein